MQQIVTDPQAKQFSQLLFESGHISEDLFEYKPFATGCLAFKVKQEDLFRVGANIVHSVSFNHGPESDTMLFMTRAFDDSRLKLNIGGGFAMIYFPDIKFFAPEEE